MLSIDLNCDMGEGCGNDEALMAFVSSVNIACGFHAGDSETMSKTVSLAVKKGVAIGAHPSFPDRKGFGRTAMNIANQQVYDIVSEQIRELRRICLEAGGRLHHVKPHGALYNQAAANYKVARTIAQAVRDIDKDLVLFGLSGSHSIAEAKNAGLRTASEVFADRTYRSNGDLTPRTEPNSLIEDTDIAISQVLQMISNKTVTSADGYEVPIDAETICIHGDGKNALQFAATLHSHLMENGILIKPIDG